MNYSLDESQSMDLLFALCADVSNLRVGLESKRYFYLRPRKLSDLSVMMYILRKFGANPHLHFTRFYLYMGECAKKLIVRVPISNNKFVQSLNDVYSQKRNTLKLSSGVPCVFPLLPRGLKNRVIANLHENVK